MNPTGPGALQHNEHLGCDRWLIRILGLDRRWHLALPPTDPSIAYVATRGCYTLVMNFAIEMIRRQHALGHTKCGLLEALDVTIFADRVQRAIDQFRDIKLWAEAEAEEQKGLRTLKSLRDNFGQVVLFLRDLEATQNP